MTSHPLLVLQLSGTQAQMGHQQPGAAAPQHQPAPGQAAPQSAVSQPAATPAASSAPAINPQTGQPDYSAQWAEYYRNLGMHDQANMIEQQAKQNQAGGAGQPQSAGAPAQPQYGAPTTAAQPAYAGGYGAPAAPAPGNGYPQQPQY